MTETRQRQRPWLAADNALPDTAEKPDYIAENLRRLYRTAESEPLPDRFQQLLARLSDEESDARAETGR